jgi:hypothetical protein
LYCFSLCIQLSLSYFCKIYRPLQPGENPFLVNIISYHISYIISYRIVSYHIIYHTISYII